MQLITEGCSSRSSLLSHGERLWLQKLKPPSQGNEGLRRAREPIILTVAKSVWLVFRLVERTLGDGEGPQR